ncbi:MAG: oligosaccharide flippase family protein [Gemmataceae bacterium]
MRPLIGRFLLLAGANVAARGMAFAATVLVVRAFGSAGLGELSFVLSIVTYAVTVGTCGLDLYAVRAVASRAAAVGDLARRVVVIRLALGTATYVTLVALALAVPSLRAVAGLVAVFGLSLLTTAVTLTWVAEGLQNVRVMALTDVGTQGLYLLLLLAGVTLAGGLWVVPVAQLLAEGLIAAALIAWVWRTFPRPGPLLPRTQWRAILAQSAPIGGARLLRAVAVGSDLVMLGFYVGMTEVGYYSAAYKLYLVGMSLGALYLVLMFPRIVRSASDSPAALQREVHASFRFVLSVGIPAVAALAACSPGLLGALFGSPFQAGARSLQLLLVTLLIQELTGHYRNVLLAQGRQTTDLTLVAVSAAAHVGLKVTLIPELGIEGAALGTLLGEALLLILTWRSARLHDGMPDREAAVPPPGRPRSGVRDNAHLLEGPSARYVGRRPAGWSPT